MNMMVYLSESPKTFSTKTFRALPGMSELIKLDAAALTWSFHVLLTDRTHV